ncbi:hypothetical protein PEL8287_01020 [Roseovarius litorisediminis]|uniref:Haem-binding uptake Tiki superfamily ChaN domain-containing protein n=1 Tax=Roseovarius litorisediminis TaxID=1312363 RepID=A0A1Y5RQQ7_9RHOB|nr:ChaN family lipoprotein [Roseovarius litorisediminis]SLN23074.1 hypothetical protein PEL8287_01020 [Roseovarius litorisediminis]
MIVRFAFLFLTLSQNAFAQDVLIIGEVHDNTAHHAVQAEKVAKFRPAALVFEMVSPARIYGEVLPQFTDPGDLEAFLEWGSSGWPDFSMYRPIFNAAPEAKVYGAHVPRSQAQAVLEDGPEQVFGAEARRYGLAEPLSARQQAQRETLQMVAHCNALPPEILPGMVEIQRLRDAVLARAAVRALEETGGPVVVITGNGHARRDWGVPSYLADVVPETTVYVIGQTEDDQPLEGGFDKVLSAPAAERPDPCAAFK